MEGENDGRFADSVDRSRRTSIGACLTATAEDFERHDDGVCRDMGLKRGTQAYADGRQSVSSQRQMAARISMQNKMDSNLGTSVPAAAHLEIYRGAI